MHAAWIAAMHEPPMTHLRLAHLILLQRDRSLHALSRTAPHGLAAATALNRADHSLARWARWARWRRPARALGNGRARARAPTLDAATRRPAVLTAYDTVVRAARDTSA